MGRATTKKDLLEQAESQYVKLEELIDGMKEEKQIGNFNFDIATIGKEAHWKRDKNIRDVLVHLYEWHMLLLNWVDSNLKGESKQFLKEGYNWKTYGEMNIEFFEMHQNTKYNVSKEMLKQSHKNVMEMINKFSNEELFEKKQFSWTGTTTLGSYCVSATSSHYDWAMKKIKKHISGK